jgi:hypothetical protein
MIIKPAKVLGMELFEFAHKGVTGHLYVDDKHATIYDVMSANRNKGECLETLGMLKAASEANNKIFGGTVALNPTMKHIYQKLEITEYDNE